LIQVLNRISNKTALMATVLCFVACDRLLHLKNRIWVWFI